MKASIAQPHSKGQLEKRGNRNQVVQTTNEETEIVNKAGSSEMRSAKRKGKILSEPEFGGGGKPNKHVRAQSKVESANHKRNNQNFNAAGNGKKGSEHDRNRNSSKKQEGMYCTFAGYNFVFMHQIYIISISMTPICIVIIVFVRSGYLIIVEDKRCLQGILRHFVIV